MSPSGVSRANRPTVWLAGLVAAALVGGCAPNITDADIKQIPIADLRKLTLRQAEKPQSRIVVLIDPRASARFDRGHLPGARNLKLPQVPELSGLDPSLTGYEYIVVYGTDPGSAAARAMTKRLIRVGYSDIRMFAGGVSEWLEKGYSVEVTPPPAPVEGDAKAPAGGAEPDSP